MKILKRMLMMFGMLCLAASFAFAQQDPKKDPPPKDPGPKVKIEENKNTNSRPKDPPKNDNKPKKPDKPE